MQGVFVNNSRPKSKKAVKEAVAADPSSVRLEATSYHPGSEYDGPVSEAPDGTFYFVGPDPYVKRSYYGTVTVKNGQATVK